MRFRRGLRGVKGNLPTQAWGVCFAAGRRPQEIRRRQGMLEMALQGRSVLDITKTLNDEGVAGPKGKHWLKTTLHKLLGNEALHGNSGCRLSAIMGHRMG